MNDEQLQAIKERYTRDYGELPASARTDVPALVAEVERLRAELAAVPVDTIRRYWEESICTGGFVYGAEGWRYTRDQQNVCDTLEEWLASIPKDGAE